MEPRQLFLDEQETSDSSDVFVSDAASDGVQDASALDCASVLSSSWNSTFLNQLATAALADVDKNALAATDALHVLTVAAPRTPPLEARRVPTAAQ